MEAGGEGGSKKFANFVLREGQQDIAYSRERRAEGVFNISASCKNIREDLAGRYDFCGTFWRLMRLSDLSEKG
jgi:hypothetical protein